MHPIRDPDRPQPAPGDWRQSRHRPDHKKSRRM